MEKAKEEAKAKAKDDASFRQVRADACYDWGSTFLPQNYFWLTSSSTEQVLPNIVGVPFVCYQHFSFYTQAVDFCLTGSSTEEVPNIGGTPFVFYRHVSCYTYEGRGIVHRGALPFFLSKVRFTHS